MKKEMTVIYSNSLMVMYININYLAVIDILLILTYTAILI